MTQRDAPARERVRGKIIQSFFVSVFDDTTFHWKTQRSEGKPRRAQLPAPRCPPTPRPIKMPYKKPSGTAKRKRKRSALENDAHPSNARQAIPGLFNEIVITHILKSDNLPDMADLASLKKVSIGMRDAVLVTGRAIYNLNTAQAAELGCLGTLQCLLRQGRLDKSEVCQFAAMVGHLGVLQWARKRLSVGRVDVCVRGSGRSPRVVEVVARKWLPVENEYMLRGGKERAPRCGEVAAHERMPVG